MSKKRCPACKSEIPAEANDCPNCPFTFATDEHVYRPKRRFGMSAWPPAVWALVVLAVMIGLGRLIEFVIAQADPDAQHTAMQKFIEQQRIVVRDKNGVDQVISEGNGAQDRAAKQVQGQQSAAVDQSLDAGQGSSDDEVEIGAQEAPPAKVTEWRLRGMVYDLVTLQPIAHCTMFFTNPSTRARFETSTDDGGSYRTIVPPLGEQGYEVTFEKDGYAKSYLNPGTENVRQMPADDRRSTAKELTEAFEPPYQVQAAGAEPLRTDFYLAPAAP